MKNLPRVIAVAFAAVAIWAGPTEATTIVVLLTGDHVYVGADSKRVTGARGANATATEACKIHQLDDGVIVAAAGGAELSVTLSGTSFDLSFEKAIAGTSWKGTLEEKANAIAALYAEQLRAVGQSALEIALPARTAAPGVFTKALDFIAALSSQFVVAGVENGAPAVSVRTLWTHVVGDKAITDIIPQTFRRGVVFVFGSRGAFERMSDQDKAAVFALPGGPDHVRRLVQNEIDAAPQFVGPPINIVDIGPGGTRWIARSIPCGAAP